jgi:subtilisin family serine protease
MMNSPISTITAIFLALSSSLAFNPHNSSGKEQAVTRNRQVAPSLSADAPSSMIFVKWKDGMDETKKDEVIRSTGISRSVTNTNHYSHIPNLTLVAMNNAISVHGAINELSQRPEIEFVEEDKTFIATRHEVIPNDAGFSQCWGHRNTGSSGGLSNFDMNSTNAWSITKGSPSIAIMVFETGVQQDHPDINQLTGRDFTTGAINGILGGGPGNQCDNHGTSVAGCITGIINNAVGTVGVAPNCKVISARVGTAITPCSGSWQGQTSWTVNAINWAIANGVRVTNNSNDYGTASTAMTNAYTAARNAGIVNFASSGNSGNTTIGYPATASSVNAVGASSRNGQRASFSSYGSKLAFVAPGQSIYTTDRTGSNGYSSNDYTTIDGTSFSSPYAAGVAALILSVNPSLSAIEVEDIMKTTCRDMGTAGYDQFTGWGMLNAEAAVLAALAGLPKPCPSDFNENGSVEGNDLGILLSYWGASNFDSRVDLTGDSAINGGDLGIFLSSWGECP